MHLYRRSDDEESFIVARQLLAIGLWLLAFGSWGSLIDFPLFCRFANTL
jgi:hypothetical protein